jgi:hypothetical protein
VRTLRWAIGVLAAETVGLVGLVVYLVYADLVGGAQSLRGAVTVTVLSALTAGLFGSLAVALRRRRSWARGPAIVLQLLLVPIGYSLASAGLAWAGLPVMALGLGGAAALIAPATREALIVGGGGA